MSCLALGIILFSAIQTSMANSPRGCILPPTTSNIITHKPCCDQSIVPTGNFCQFSCARNPRQTWGGSCNDGIFYSPGHTPIDLNSLCGGTSTPAVNNGFRLTPNCYNWQYGGTGCKVQRRGNDCARLTYKANQIHIVVYSRKTSGCNSNCFSGHGCQSVPDPSSHCTVVSCKFGQGLHCCQYECPRCVVRNPTVCCDGSGWKPPTCTPQCGAFTFVENAIHSDGCKDDSVKSCEVSCPCSNFEGEDTARVRFVCNNGILVREDKGRNVNLVCHLGCATLPEIQHATLRDGCVENAKDGAECQFFCANGYRALPDSRIISDLRAGRLECTKCEWTTGSCTPFTQGPGPTPVPCAPGPRCDHARCYPTANCMTYVLVCEPRYVTPCREGYCVRKEVQCQENNCAPCGCTPVEGVLSESHGRTVVKLVEVDQAAFLKSLEAIKDITTEVSEEGGVTTVVVKKAGIDDDGEDGQGDGQGDRSGDSEGDGEGDGQGDGNGGSGNGTTIETGNGAIGDFGRIQIALLLVLAVATL